MVVKNYPYLRVETQTYLSLAKCNDGLVKCPNIKSVQFNYADAFHLKKRITKLTNMCEYLFEEVTIGRNYN